MALLSSCGDLQCYTESLFKAIVVMWHRMSRLFPSRPTVVDNPIQFSSCGAALSMGHPAMGRRLHFTYIGAGTLEGIGP